MAKGPQQRDLSVNLFFFFKQCPSHLTIWDPFPSIVERSNIMLMFWEGLLFPDSQQISLGKIWKGGGISEFFACLSAVNMDSLDVRLAELLLRHPWGTQCL